MKGYLKFLLVIGFSWWCTEFVFLRRDWQKDQKLLETSLETLKDFPFPFWVGEVLTLGFDLVLCIESVKIKFIIKVDFCFPS